MAEGPSEEPKDEPEGPLSAPVGAAPAAADPPAEAAEPPPQADPQQTEPQQPEPQQPEPQHPGPAPQQPGPGSPADGSGPPSRGLRSWWVRRRGQIESNWSRVGSEINRTRLLVKVFLLHVRYVFGYLAFGFAVSAPLQLGRLHEKGWEEGVFKSLVLGVICGVPFLLLWPLTIIAWERMRIPEFKNLELGLTRWAALVAAFFVLACGVVRWPLRLEGFVAWLFDPQIGWITFGLMFFAWLRVKFHTVIFREFYTLKPDEDLVLRVPPSRVDLPQGAEGEELE